MAKIAYENNYFKPLLSALSNETCYAIIFSLKQKPKNVSSICMELGKNQTTISHNLQRLLDCGFVFSERKGKEKIYSLNKETILPLVRLIEKHTHCYCSGLCNCNEHKGAK